MICLGARSLRPLALVPSVNRVATIKKFDDRECFSGLVVKTLSCGLRDPGSIPGWGSFYFTQQTIHILADIISGLAFHWSISWLLIGAWWCHPTVLCDNPYITATQTYFSQSSTWPAAGWTSMRGPQHCKYLYFICIINSWWHHTSEAREMVRPVPVLLQGWWAIFHACLLYLWLGFRAAGQHFWLGAILNN